jgi:heparosan-N-sulfate-glucuronate 5-epimerase
VGRKVKKLALSPIPTGSWKGKKDDPHNPYILIRYAIELYNDYLMKKSKSLKTLFIQSADSLANRLIIKNKIGTWPYYCLFPRAKMYGCRIPWISALAQGQGISVLLRAYSLVNHKKYLETAEYALKIFNIPVQDGGVLYKDEDSHWWYEEYACPRAEPSGVLNGFILAILGIYDFYHLTDDNLSKQLFEKGISTLRHHLKDFDTNYPYKLTYYDRQKHIVSFEYHLFHIKLMRILYQITKEEIFKMYQNRWEKQKEAWAKSRMNKFAHTLYYLKSGYSMVQSAEIFFRNIYRVPCSCT